MKWRWQLYVSLMLTFIWISSSPRSVMKKPLFLNINRSFFFGNFGENWSDGRTFLIFFQIDEFRICCWGHPWKEPFMPRRAVFLRWFCWWPRSCPLVASDTNWFGKCTSLGWRVCRWEIEAVSESKVRKKSVIFVDIFQSVVCLFMAFSSKKKGR